MGLFGLLGIARDGVAAQSAALTTTGTNVANVATPGYTRRTALLETATAGGGVRYAGTGRTFDRFAYAHVVDEQGKHGAASARSDALSEVEATLAPPTGSIGEHAVAMMQAWNAFASAPTDPSLRADVVARTSNFADSLRTTRAALEATSEKLLGTAGDVVTELNANLSRIADLNEQIATATASGGDPASLRDQRDTAIRNVGERIGARAIEDKTGRLTVYGGGAVLVEGDHASPVSIDLDPSGAVRFYVTGASKNEVTARVDTGTLGGLREARDRDVARSIEELDAYAFDVANAFNAVHAAGFGTDGATGRSLFAISATEGGAASTIALEPSLVGHPERVAGADASGTLPGGNAVARELAGLADRPVFGGATLPDRFASMATGVGFRKASADAEVSLRTDTLAVAESLSESANGVSLDEEMVNLSRYQRAFEAQVKILRAADEMLASLMESF